ncbi:MAG: hypothetical protein LAO51_07235 [Acidobacteriia bacterium]|nr:hypothetical protein [Terriglobia bacterium]
MSRRTKTDRIALELALRELPGGSHDDFLEHIRDLIRDFSTRMQRALREAAAIRIGDVSAKERIVLYNTLRRGMEDLGDVIQVATTILHDIELRYVMQKTFLDMAVSSPRPKKPRLPTA